MCVFWKNEQGSWDGKRYKTTTDPSTRILGDLSYNSKGTAILPAGQYVDTWKIRLHSGSYEALGQQRKLCVYRDYDRTDTLTFDIENQDCGLFGINIHRAKKNGADDGQGNTEVIGPYSAGCQVFQNYYCFLEFMEMCRRQRDLYGNNFTYTLIDKSLERKFRIKRTIYWTSVATGLGLIGYGFWLQQGKPSLPLLGNPGFKYPPHGRVKAELMRMGVVGLEYMQKSSKKPVLLYKGYINGKLKGFAVGVRPQTDMIYVEKFNLN
jgi:hypothetical protein